jgi:hypothetical protein
MNSEFSFRGLEWTGDLRDDCTALWNGLMLRAEKMDHEHWWWAVTTESGSGYEIDSSNNHEGQCPSGEMARMRAEICAQDFATRAGGSISK